MKTMFCVLMILVIVFGCNLSNKNTEMKKQKEEIVIENKFINAIKNRKHLTFLTNLDGKYKPSVVEASMKSGLLVKISDVAKTTNGIILKNHIGLYAVSDGDYSNFWEEFNKLNNKQNLKRDVK